MSADEQHAALLSILRRAAGPVSTLTALAVEAERTASTAQPEEREPEHHHGWSQTADWLRMLAAQIPHHAGTGTVEFGGKTLATKRMRITPLFAPSMAQPPTEFWVVELTGEVADGSHFHGLVGPFPGRAIASGWLQDNLVTGSATIVPLSPPNSGVALIAEQDDRSVGDAREIES